MTTTAAEVPMIFPARKHAAAWTKAQALADAEQRVYVITRVGDSPAGSIHVAPATFWTLDELLARRVNVVAPFHPGRVASAMESLKEAFRS